MNRGTDPAKAPKKVALYERTVQAPLARVWENVYDWEHLPWLHSESFASIVLEESGRWGWRALVGLHPVEAAASIRIELLVDRAEARYVTRTLEGPGAGTEIWTALSEVSSAETAISVGFHLPGVGTLQARTVGESLVELYTRLWDQDEAMIQERERQGAGRAREVSPVLPLGSLSQLRGELPKTVEFEGLRVRLEEDDDVVRAHFLVCPHWSGPLKVDPADPKTLVCPWHGYRFDLRTGRSCDGHGLQLRSPPEVVIEEEKVFLRSSGGGDRG